MKKWTLTAPAQALCEKSSQARLLVDTSESRTADGAPVLRRAVKPPAIGLMSPYGTPPGQAESRARSEAKRLIRDGEALIARGKLTIQQATLYGGRAFIVTPEVIEVRGPVTDRALLAAMTGTTDVWVHDAHLSRDASGALRVVADAGALDVPSAVDRAPIVSGWLTAADVPADHRHWAAQWRRWAFDNGRVPSGCPGWLMEPRPLTWPQGGLRSAPGATPGLIAACYGVPRSGKSPASLMDPAELARAFGVEASTLKKWASGARVPAASAMHWSGMLLRWQEQLMMGLHRSLDNAGVNITKKH